ncbi:MAG: cyclic nucleotide-binding domain-containing protein [Magnetococcales bacterium]|nr:cyclic nucleotide-binding domain-containing protein [Magnetococcales bacterium]MBF0439581.1 cyclic nucleotide-binding domain-containing protein [Magnetococcales bacterium]
MDSKSLLDRIAFFSRFSEVEKHQILCAQHHFVKFSAGEYLVRENDNDDTLYIILKGTAHVVKSSKPNHVLAKLTPGMIIGEVSFLTRRNRITSVIADDEMICFTINGSTMEELSVYSQNKIKDQLIEILVQRLDQTNQTLLDTITAVEGMVYTVVRK